MNILMLMIPISLFLGIAFLAAFAWAIENGQYEDTETPAHRILENENQEREKNERIH